MEKNCDTCKFRDLEKRAHPCGFCELNTYLKPKSGHINWQPIKPRRKELQAENERLKNLLVDKDAEIEDMWEQISARHADIADLTAQLAAKDAEIAALNPPALLPVGTRVMVPGIIHRIDSDKQASNVHFIDFEGNISAAFCWFKNPDITVLP